MAAFLRKKGDRPRFDRVNVELGTDLALILIFQKLNDII